MGSEEKLKRKTWVADETILFLKCYAARKEEFVHTRKKRFAYSHVLEDMFEQGFTDTSATVHTLESKMRTLLTTYNSAKANEKVPYSFAPYMKYMDAIYEHNIQEHNVNKLSVGISQPEYIIDVPIHQLSPKSETSINQSLSQQSPTSSSPPQQLLPPPSPASQPNKLSVKISQPEIFIDVPIHPPSPKLETSINHFLSQQSPTLPSLLKLLPPPSPSSPPSPPSPEQPKTSRKKKTARERYYEEKIKLRKRIAKERLEEKRRFHNSVVETIRDIELKKLEILKKSLTS